MVKDSTFEKGMKRGSLNFDHFSLSSLVGYGA